MRTPFPFKCDLILSHKLLSPKWQQQLSDDIGKTENKVFHESSLSQSIILDANCTSHIWGKKREKAAAATLNNADFVTLWSIFSVS